MVLLEFTTVGALDDIEEIQRQRRRHREQGLELEARLEECVRAAFAEGYTGPEIAAAAGISKPRVYQINAGKR